MSGEVCGTPVCACVSDCLCAACVCCVYVSLLTHVLKICRLGHNGVRVRLHVFVCLDLPVSGGRFAALSV